MFVLTVDQIGSRSHADAVRSGIGMTLSALGDPVIEPERTAGDEFQAITPDAERALDALLALARDGGWSVGLGVGGVVDPLPMSIREATGDAFLGARTAVDRAKRKQTRSAIAAPAAASVAERCEALVDVLVALRARRSPEGWELADLLEAGMTQAAAAARLGITPQAVSRRALAADLRVDAAARAALVDLLRELDETAGRA
ncbi:DNA-binding protein [Galbitalea sp. SE-J8]|uniref:DNA-binding protein n=1 Tax=Galbitalea sp. SE-J8 TaxID=3054952 RepID=UPI00259C7C5E|nr:DNA-binding protein [Galbitalea sp. SE-J8]MDM4762518.1 DNA-binding protein [Galbitalea sp. SE-J8]